MIFIQFYDHICCFVHLNEKFSCCSWPYSLMVYALLHIWNLSSFVLFKYHYASTSLSCAGIQWWKSISFHFWAAINLVCEMSNEEEATPPPTKPHPPLVIRSRELSEKSNEEEDTPSPPHPLLVIRSWELSEMSSEEGGHPINKNIMLQCWHTEAPGVWLVDQ